MLGNLKSAGIESNGEVGGGFAVLDSDVYRESRWCANCAGDVLFVEVFETDFGRGGFCMGCGEEKFVAFSRATGKAA